MNAKLKKLFVKKHIYFGMIFIVFIGVCCGGYLYKTKASETVNDAPVYIEQTVKKGNITIDFIADGAVDIPVINVDFPISGKLKEVMAEVGQMVKKGQMIAKLDDTDYVNKLESARVSYEKAQTDYQQQRITEKRKVDELKNKLDTVNLEYLPMTQIPDAFSEQEIERKRLEYENAKSAYEAELQTYNILSNINVKSAELALKAAQDDFQDTVLTAPIDAKVFAVNYKSGETVSSPKNNDTTSDNDHFMLMTNTDKINVVAPISEIDLPQITIGQGVEVTFEAFEGHPFTGKVLSIDPLPKIDNSGLVTYDVNIELDNGLNKMKTGMTCTVSFILKQKKNVMVIPNKAVTMIDGKQTVQIKDEKGNVMMKMVKTGLTDGKNVEVLEGLKVGEVVMIRQ